MTPATGGFPPLSESDFDLSAGLGDEEDNGALREIMVAEIRAQGPISFRRFMEIALYDPSEGYYCTARNRIGRDGDYVTSPEMSPLFGYALARQLSELWARLDRPNAFAVIEAGAGSGRLARDVLRWLRTNAPDCYTALTYTLVEQSRVQRAFQAEILAAEIEAGIVQVAPEIPAAEAEHGCVFANELLDAFPVHRVTLEDDRLREIYVDYSEPGFVERIGAPSTPALEAYFGRLGVAPVAGCVAEVCLGTGSWLRKVAGALARGYLLLLDYGYPAERKYAAWRRDGTLLCYHRHQAVDDPYRFIGRQDLTAHVDLTTVRLEAEAAGLQPIAITTQARFLAGLGLGASVAQPSGSPHAMQEYYARRRAVAALLDPDGLGRVAVMLLAKDAPAGRFSGFAAAAGPQMNP